MLKLGFETLYDVYTFPRPVIAEVTGHAIALGIFLVSCCDYRIGAKGDYVLQANEVRNKMSIPTQLIEIAASRVQKAHIYRALFHAEPYPIKIGVDANMAWDFDTAETFIRETIPFKFKFNGQTCQAI